MVAGVCGGLADYFDLDPILVRIGFIMLAFMNGAGIVVYIVLWLIVPERNKPNSKKLPTTATQSSPVAHLIGDVKESTEHAVEEITREHPWLSRPRNIIGIILITLGALIFLDEFAGISFLRWDYVWPIALVGIGYLILSRK